MSICNESERQNRSVADEHRHFFGGIDFRNLCRSCDDGPEAGLVWRTHTKPGCVQRLNCCTRTV